MWICMYLYIIYVYMFILVFGIGILCYILLDVFISYVYYNN